MNKEKECYACVYPDFELENLEPEVLCEKHIKSRADRYTCKHSLWDYTYWGSKYPKCSKCGWEDKTREL